VVPERVPKHGMLFALQTKLEPLDVYVCAGQSNMAGAGEKASLPPELQAAQTNVFVFNGTGWDVMEPTATGVGPEISFAYAMQQALGKPIGIILHAVGGTNLATNWNPLLTADAGNLYAVLTNKVEAARQTREINVKGMIWMQGENDSKKADMAAAYGQNLTNLVLAARADFQNPSMSFVAGRVNPLYAYVALVRAAQESCALPGYSWVDCDDLPKNPDNLHYNTDGQVLLGQRFAAKILVPNP
ncbi:MAG: sialate O-acetylesterase, partial [Kiritimatiellales bacterium]|nr:sialate O-acetylesterase [Kiritimatiellales bacterium]